LHAEGEVLGERPPGSVLGRRRRTTELAPGGERGPDRYGGEK